MKRTWNEYTIETGVNAAGKYVQLTVTADRVRTEMLPWPEDAETDEEAIEMTIEWLEEQQ